jgi:hypothetical protein
MARMISALMQVSDKRRAVQNLSRPCKIQADLAKIRACPEKRIRRGRFLRSAGSGLLPLRFPPCPPLRERPQQAQQQGVSMNLLARLPLRASGVTSRRSPRIGALISRRKGLSGNPGASSNLSAKRLTSSAPGPGDAAALAQRMRIDSRSLWRQ